MGLGECQTEGNPEAVQTRQIVNQDLDHGTEHLNSMSEGE